MELLSQHQCEGWLKGHLLTGRHGLFNCYEAFIHIIKSIFNEHAKWLKVTARLPWRMTIASLNDLLASHVWRQDHNGFTPQNLGCIDHIVNKKAVVVCVYVPPDANCLRSRYYINVVDLMKLQPQTEHPHRLSDSDSDELFTRDKPVIFAFHACPWLIHRLTSRRTNHDTIYVRGYKEEGSITTHLDMTVLNDLDRFHLVMDTIDRLPQTGDKGIDLKPQLKDKLIEHKPYIDKHGQHVPGIHNGKWNATHAGEPA